jgi:hypothetical protein
MNIKNERGLNLIREAVAEDGTRMAEINVRDGDLLTGINL